MGSPQNGDRQSHGPADGPSESRRPYSKPRIISREVLEVMAGICPDPLGKASGTCMIPTS